jgi:uncharacterized protein YecT (DUF1311 family)
VNYGKGFLRANTVGRQLRGFEGSSPERYNSRMKFKAAVMLVAALPVLCYAQATTQDIYPAQLQAILDLPLNQAVQRRETYKGPLKSAYERQTSMVGYGCQAEQGQQPYNICMGQATEQADKDYAIFYNNLQMLCHDQDQLTTLQASEKAWKMYEGSALKATRAAWSEGTGASGFGSQVYLSLVRDHMRELGKIYGLNITQ